MAGTMKIWAEGKAHTHAQGLDCFAHYC